MSAAGYDAAMALSAIDPERAATLAAELRNAITPAACARGDETCSREDLEEAVGWTLNMVRQVIEALAPEASHGYQDLQRDPDGVVEALGIGRAS